MTRMLCRARARKLADTPESSTSLSDRANLCYTVWFLASLCQNGPDWNRDPALLTSNDVAKNCPFALHDSPRRPVAVHARASSAHVRSKVAHVTLDSTLSANPACPDVPAVKLAVKELASLDSLGILHDRPAHEDVPIGRDAQAMLAMRQFVKVQESSARIKRSESIAADARSMSSQRRAIGRPGPAKAWVADAPNCVASSCFRSAADAWHSKSPGLVFQIDALDMAGSAESRLSSSMSTGQCETCALDEEGGGLAAVAKHWTGLLSTSQRIRGEQRGRKRCARGWCTWHVEEGKKRRYQS
ncbi:hypothetical protein DOTSEDRAFT_35201 [Dothistroma septosporum NZE10]|uniref:Uncharacterized protein n=1 Tax=Dothistroma septosporum (strain NZE10 / CBS 128990) TaxID=675120 RepID=M2YLC1_DOTSN|nr:hypothetical protein DOTSEDRAFT_35201 [Dothistroma septosporum NZE10]